MRVLRSFHTWKGASRIGQLELSGTNQGREREAQTKDHLIYKLRDRK